jgi:hypothetical protein
VGVVTTSSSAGPSRPGAAVAIRLDADSRIDWCRIGLIDICEFDSAAEPAVEQRQLNVQVNVQVAQPP